ncbi:MAG: hypothetical protein M3032_12685 [Verrucomicrobiota bacterium]|nr:hypothetical protein [Verrucomicrobiota bacterium]
MKRLLVICSLGAMLAATLHADVTVSLSPSVQNSARGREIVFNGTITNTGPSKVYLNDIASSLIVGSGADLPLKPNSFFANVPGVLLPGEAYMDSELFRVALTSSAPTSDYRGTVTVRGGGDIFANGDLASVGFAVLSPAVDAAATDASASEFGPDPGLYTISRTGGTDIALVVPLAMSGSAIAGSDYEALPSSAVIPAGSSSVGITLLPVPNNIAQGDRLAQLTITASSSYNFGTSVTSSITIHDKPADAWRFSYFGANANDAAAADDADWDHDGIANLLEFALGSDPTNGGASNLPMVARAGDSLLLRFVPNAAALDVNFVVEGSSDLLNWSASNAEFVPYANPGSTVTYRYKGPITTSSRGFLRLRVLRTDL